MTGWKERTFSSDKDSSTVSIMWQENGFMCVIWYMEGVSQLKTMRESGAAVEELLDGRDKGSAALVIDSLNVTGVDVAPYHMSEIATKIYSRRILAVSISLATNRITRFFTKLMNTILFKRYVQSHTLSTLEQAKDTVTRYYSAWVVSNQSQAK